MENTPETPALIPVSSTHARALKARFRTVEEYCRTISSSLDGFEGIFYVSEARIPEAGRARIRALVGRLLEGLSQIRQELGLQPAEVSATGIVRAYLGELWAVLSETRGRDLRGYGEVPKALGAYLDRRVDELDFLVSEIRRIIEPSPEPPKTGGAKPVAGTPQSTAEDARPR